MKDITLVVAMAENGVIGDGSKLLWHLPNDLKHFKALTMGKPIVMGRKTYESIGKPLPGRQNIILTHARYLRIPGCDVVHSVNEALDKTDNAAEVMIIGGGEIYRLFMPLASKIHVTLVKAQVDGAVTFEYDQKEWLETERVENYKDEKHAFDYSFVTLIRN